MCMHFSVMNIVCAGGCTRQKKVLDPLELISSARDIFLAPQIQFYKLKKHDKTKQNKIAFCLVEYIENNPHLANGMFALT